MISVYIDTNCINAKKSIDAINELENLYEQGKILIEKTDTLDTELQKGKGYPSGIKKSMDYTESYGPAVFGHSRWGFSIWGDESDNQRLSKILSTLWGAKVRAAYSEQEMRDAMHISTVIRYGGTYFVTQEKAILARAGEIEIGFGIKVCNPVECLREIQEYLKKHDNNR